MDLIVRGGTVVTMDAARAVLRADVRVRGREIVEVGVTGEGGATVLDAAGCAVIPGLVQAHVHLCQALFRGMADDLPLLEWLRQRIWPLEAAHDERSLAASARLGLAEMLRAGTTSILDMGTVHHHDVVFEAMAESGIRGFSGKTMMDAGEEVPKGLRERTRASLRESERLCDRWDGAEGGMLGYAFAPRFILSCTEELMRETAALARDKGARMHSHVAEHADERAAVRQALGVDDVEALASFGLSGPRCVLAHGVQLRRDEMKRIAAAETRIAHCPSANLKLASGIADVRAMRDAGIVVGIGADGAPCNNRMDPWTELRQAALLAKAKRGDAAALPALAALEMATIDGARALGIDDRVGSIEVGKQADITVVRLDGLHVEPVTDVVGALVYACTAADVKHVVVGGRVAVKNGELTTLDVARVRADARKQASAARERAGLCPARGWGWSTTPSPAPRSPRRHSAARSLRATSRQFWLARSVQGGLAMTRLVLLLASSALAACSASHRIDRADSGGRDAGPVERSDSGPVIPGPMPGPCGTEPEAPECRTLCDEACEAFAACGGDFDACIAGCYAAYACPGETPGHDASICGAEGFAPRSCEETCSWVETYGGYGTGPSCPTATPCRGRSYCDCTAGCEPLIDHTTGCICECDEPFRCGGPECACVCGGATYLGCAPVGECPEPRVTCSDPAGARVVDGCPVCP